MTSPGALAALRHFARAWQLMLGFDFPFMPPATIAPALATIDHFKDWSAAERSQICAGTALRLCPRLALGEEG